MNELSFALKSQYGINVDSIFPTAGGFSAKAYRVTGMDGAEYFLKVYDKSLPTTRFFVERIDMYMPALDRLSSLPALRGRTLTPVPTRNGPYKAEINAGVCVLFLYVHGKPPGAQGMTRTQTAELAGILALLHDSSENIPFETSGLAEDISLPFCGQITRFLSTSGAEPGALFDLVAPHAGLLLSAVNETLRLRDKVRSGYVPLVLCHGDAHGNNVIQSEHLVLADWEDLRLAPAEADLFIHAWHPHGDILLETYSAARRGYRINRELLYFYILRRRIEDVWTDIQRLTEESPDEAEAVKLLERICRGIGEINTAFNTR